MSYVRTVWKDTLRDGQGNKIQEGTPVNAKNLNKIEDGIYNLKSEIAPIYGVYFDLTKPDSKGIRTDDAVGMVANVGLGNELVRNDFDTAAIYRRLSNIKDEHGNWLKDFPEFWLEDEWTETFVRIRVSEFQFGSARRVKPFKYGRFPGSLSDDGKRLESKPGKFPLNYRNIEQFRTLAMANNTETSEGFYHQLDGVTYDPVVALILVEFATLNLQSVMAGFTQGRYTATDIVAEGGTNTNTAILPKATAALYRVGQTFEIGTSQGGRQIAKERVITAINELDADRTEIVFDGAPVDIPENALVWNYAYKTGSSLGIAASSGGHGSLTDGKHSFNWRGIEDIWGNVWEFVDGININDWQAWTCDDPTQYKSNVFAHPYKQLGYINASDNGYPTQMGFDPENPAVKLPVKLGGSASTHFADYYYQAAGSRIVLVGGSWFSGSTAGPFSWACNYVATSSRLLLGGRLLNTAL